MMPLRSGRLQVGDDVGSLALLPDAREDHLGSWDVLLGVLQVHRQRVLLPGDSWGIFIF